MHAMLDIAEIIPDILIEITPAALYQTILDVFIQRSLRPLSPINLNSWEKKVFHLILYKAKGELQAQTRILDRENLQQSLAVGGIVAIRHLSNYIQTFCKRLERPQHGKLRQANSCWQTSKRWQTSSCSRQTRAKSGTTHGNL